MINVQTHFCKLLTSIALVFALVSSSFAHTGFRPALSPDLAAYVAAGGSLVDFCGKSSEKEVVQGQKCDVCRLIGAIFLPQAYHGAPLVVLEQTLTLSFVAKRLHHTRPLDPSRLTRAPPQA
jgi:hypothetical protein